jgi:hypothetical protein
MRRIDLNRTRSYRGIRMQLVSPPSESSLLPWPEADIVSSESPYYHLGHYYDTLSATPAQMYVLSVYI